MIESVVEVVPVFPGDPKPSLMYQFKMSGLTTVMPSLTDLVVEDVVYNCLPLYHTSGQLGLLGVVWAGESQTKGDISIIKSRCRVKGHLCWLTI